VHNLAEAPIVSDKPRERVHAGESLVVLTRDSALVESLKGLGPQHHLATVTGEADLANELMAGRAGVAVIDAANIVTPLGAFAERLRSQFPDLVLIVAGGQDDQTALTTHITNGTVYRFLHKPVSVQRVRLFVEAAWRRHGEELSGAAESASTTGVLPQAQAGLPRSALIGGGIALAVLLALGGWFVIRKQTAGEVSDNGASRAAAVVMPPRDDVLEDLIARADKALASGSLVAPSGVNAAYLYKQATRRNHTDSRGIDGIKKVIDKLLTAADQQLSTQQLDEAQKLIEQARALEPDNVRVSFLTTQLGKARERAVLAQAREAASSGNLEGAIAVLDGTPKGDSHSAPAADTRETQKKLDDRVADYLAKATERMRAGHLDEPAQDNAKFFIESALAIAPNDPAIQQAEKQLDDALGAKAKAAAQAAAAAPPSPAQEQQPVTAEVDQPPATAPSAATAQSVPSATGAPSTTSLSSATGVPSTTSLSSATGVPSTTSLPSATGVPSTTNVPSAAAAPDAATPAPQSAADEIVSAGSLELAHYTAPAFPDSARLTGVSGWVDVQFLVKADGSVSDPRIVGAEPVGVFEQSAMDAIRKWRYKPVLREGNAVDQRARLRMKFALDNK
jgi:TonB family protein